jgi:uncharacterized protein YndB with AHSA1/START domain
MATPKNKKDVVVRRIFSAPRERVWKAWTEPEELKKWWGPKNFTSPVSRIHLREGGKYLHCMRGPDGKEYWSTGVYREIVPGELLVATDSFSDPKGKVVPASYYGMPGKWPQELLVTVTFREQDGKTRMTLRHQGIPAGKMRSLCEQGWKESFDKLAAGLKEEAKKTTAVRRVGLTEIIAEPGKQEIVLTRVFDAPLETVFNASLDPDLISQWWGPRRFTVVVDKIEARPGGMWRFINRDASGNEYAFHGVHHEILAPKRIVRTFESSTRRTARRS